jgi:hypothetical protein
MAPNRPTAAQSGQSLDSLEALVTVHYTTKITDVISESLEVNTQVLRLDHKLFVRKSGRPLTEEQAPGLLSYGMSLRRDRFDVLPPFSDDITNLPGSVNLEPYVSTLMEKVFDTETLLYQTPTITRKVGSSNLTKYDMTKLFNYQPQGWNKFYFADTDAWEYIFLSSDLTNPFLPYPVNSFVNILP